MKEIVCPHCGEKHPTDASRCPTTLKKLPRQRVERVPRHARLVLVAQDGTLLQLEVGATVVLGRDQSSPIAEACTDNVSGFHARVTASGANELVLFDTKSTNGTFVNSQRIPPERDYSLSSDDVVELGSDPPFRILVRKRQVDH